MTMAYGMDGIMGMSFQDSMNAPNTSEFVALKFISETISDNMPPLIQEGITGRFEEGDIFEGAHEVTGDIVKEVHPLTIGYLLKGWCGQSSPSAIASDYWQHVFEPVKADWGDLAAVPPMTIEATRDVGSSCLYSNMCVDVLTLEFVPGAFVKATASFVGGVGSDSAKFVNPPSSFDFLAGSEFTWDETSISLGGNAIDEIKDMTITMANALEAIGTLNASKYPNRILRSGYRSIEIAGTILFTSTTEYDIWKAQTSQRLVVTTTQGSNQMEIDVPKMIYTEFPRNISGPGRVEVPFMASAKYSTTSAEVMTITLTNTQTAY